MRSALQLSDAEDELGDWLERHGVEEGWGAGLDTRRGRASTSRGATGLRSLLAGPALRPGLEWVAGTMAMGALLGELREATGRVSELVNAVRSYTQMDRAALQPVDVVEGLESTLVILHHKLKKSIEVVRDYAPDLPRIDAYAGELNQVWTNLIDNAIDAIDGVGTLRVTTRADDAVGRRGDRRHRPGLAPEVAARAFDAFFTTKDVGRGTGLGLDIARRVVVERHAGAITIGREGDETVVRVTLPR